MSVLVVCYSCSSPGNSDNGLEVLSINVSTSIDSVDITSAFDSVRYIALETSDSCLLKTVKKMVITDQNVYILDDQVYVFDLHGNFSHLIGKKGKGPGELASAMDFIVDATSGNVEINDFMRRQLCIYSRDGTYQGSQEFPFGSVDRFEKSDKGDYIFRHVLSNIAKDGTNFLGYKIYVGNFKDDFVSYRPCYEYDGNMHFEQTFSKNGNKYYFCEILNDTIFEIDSKNNFYAKYYIDFGKNKLPPSIMSIPLEDRVYKLSDKYELATAIDHFYVCPDFVYFTFLHNKEMHNAFVFGDSTLIGTGLAPY